MVWSPDFKCNTFDDDHKNNGSDDVYNDVDAPIRDKIRPKQVSSKAPIG